MTKSRKRQVEELNAALEAAIPVRVLVDAENAVIERDGYPAVCVPRIALRTQWRAPTPQAQ